MHLIKNIPMPIGILRKALYHRPNVSLRNNTEQ